MKLTLFTCCLVLASGLVACSEPRIAAPEKAAVPVIRIHPALAAVRQALSSLPDDIAASIFSKIETDPDSFLRLLELAAAQNRAAENFLQLVDKTHSLPADYSPTDLVSLQDFRLDLARTPLFLRQILIPDLQAMVQAARTEGITLLISSTYRSYDYQAEVYARHVRNMGQAAADLVSAQPGHSQHQLGTAIDFGSITDAFAETAAGKWLEKNASKFGFSLSYPKDSRDITGYNWESWHYRYIGRTAAQLEQQYFMGMQQYLLQFWSDYFTNTGQP